MIFLLDPPYHIKRGLDIVLPERQDNFNQCSKLRERNRWYFFPQPDFQVSEEEVFSGCHLESILSTAQKRLKKSIIPSL